MTKNDSFGRWATSQLNMTLEECAFYALDAWQIEVCHRGLKQNAGIERSQFRLLIAQRNHIVLATRAFVRLEVYRLKTALLGLKPNQSLFARLSVLTSNILPTSCPQLRSS